MSKAAKAIRRGSVRLRSSLGSGHTSLNLLLSELSSTRQRYKDLVTTEISAARCLQKWGQGEEIPALQDVLHQVCELHLMWADIQRDFIAALKEYKRVYEHILEMEKKLDQARKQLTTCEDKERKLQKELVKGPKEPFTLQEKLQQATDSKMLADAEVTGLQRETEAIKMMSIRAGLLDISQSWATLGRKCNVLAESQREMALLIPDVNTRMQEMPVYTGNRESTRILYSARTQLEHLEPPPYTSKLASYPSSTPSSSSHTSRPSSARSQSSPSSSSSPRRSSAPDLVSSARHKQVLQTIDQEYDSFDSFDSD